MWRRRRTVRRLAVELAEARAEQAELRRRMAALELIAPAEAPPDLVAPVPAALAAASRDLHATEVPVRLDVAGAEAVAVIGAAGDPQQWWAAIWRLAGAGRGPHVIRVRHEALPAGLSALVRRRADGGLDVIVSTALSAGRRRAAVRTGLRAIEPGRRGTGPLPLAALIMLALSGTWLRAIGRLIRLWPAATIAAVATASVTAVVIAVAPPLHGPRNPGPNPAGAAQSPGFAGGPAPAPLRATPTALTGTRPLPTAMPVAAHSPAGGTATPVPAVPEQQPTPSALQPTRGSSTPSATPTPASTAGGGICLAVLGLWVCL